LTVADLTETELIERVRRQLATPPDWVLVGIGDDAAVVEPERNRVEVLTCDASLEGVHFDRAFTPPEAIGHRALAATLSDLAAMGAVPRLALLSLALPADLPCDDFDRIVTGLAVLAARHRLHVVGGNLVRTPGPLTLDITALGTVKRRQALLRAGARPGDELYVTGSVGAAAAGLQMLREAPDASGPPDGGPHMRYLYPEPRLRTGLLLGRTRAATACVDLSDGLADAVWRIAEASGVGAVIDGDSLPIDAAVREWFETRGTDPVAAAMTGGDDYELLFAARPRLRGRLKAAARHGGVPVARIGVCTDDRAVLVRRAGHPDAPLARGYTHFR
jgi:thiamine-monophosphate kinase